MSVKCTYRTFTKSVSKIFSKLEIIQAYIHKEKLFGIYFSLIIYLQESLGLSCK